jgi:hypothetical protein
MTTPEDRIRHSILSPFGANAPFFIVAKNMPISHNSRVQGFEFLKLNSSPGTKKNRPDFSRMVLKNQSKSNRSIRNHVHPLSFMASTIRLTATT